MANAVMLLKSKDSLAAVKADINRLKKENSELSTSQAELEEVKDLVKHLREENSDLKANCEKKTHEIENLLSQVSQLTEENLTLKSSCQRVREDEDLGRYFGEENLKLKADSEKIAQENKALLSQVNHLTEENLELKTNFQKVQESTDLVKQLREENFTMKEDSRKKAQEIKALVSEVEKLKKMVKFQNNPVTPRSDGNHSRKQGSRLRLSSGMSSSQPLVKRTKIYIDDEDE
ncbi:centrosomal protein of 83 kDa isoform X2 [Frankliniella occidentalis]|uniref:Centrosomal protein of 83 kDa isoform X2 n=1 Tax=Frankliniella occidentalis TaxID=133901 RepID=A0A9C6X4M2_FRAOC|nr:centrosomal protein of 83 kDa isoform X2 [Frankliniella occidentalis]